MNPRSMRVWPGLLDLLRRGIHGRAATALFEEGFEQRQDHTRSFVAIRLAQGPDTQSGQKLHQPLNWKEKELEHIYILVIMISREVDGAFTLKQPKSMGAVYALFTSLEEILTSVTSSVGAFDLSNRTRKIAGWRNRS